MFHSEYEKKLRSPSKSPSSSKSYYQSNGIYSSPIPLPLSSFFQTNIDSNNNNTIILTTSNENYDENRSPIKRSPSKTTNLMGTPTTASTNTVLSNDSYGDRFIPMSIGIESQNHYSMEESNFFYPSENNLYTIDRQKDESHLAYNMILKNELLGSLSSSFLETISASPIKQINSNINNNNNNNNNNTANNSNHQQNILDAPMIKDDFYLNLIDWSSQNILAVGLDTSVYLWNATTSQVSKLCEMEPNQPVSSVGWIQRGTHLAIGGNDGIVQIWDVTKKKKIRELQGHSSRVNSLAWNNYILSSGGKDKVILNHDVRSSENSFASRLVGHRHEICGLKWSPDGQQLASGGNDNLLNVWDNSNSSKPLYQFKFHYAAVKAIAWSPHQRGLLASGGGTHDKCIRFWNTMNGQSIQSIDTGSQVCNLAWSKNVNELVSTHGYSQNQISVWSYPSMTPVTTLTGHTMRVLYLAVSPDGQTVCTGAGDHSLRFWNIFPSNKESSFSTKLDSFYNKKELDIR
ncbi:hypothetical protein DICPUDRAFT_157280 [Dictyostelium purpureum]|uniref:CDC20/Fizzy WD40 domain-containing protein n=1 Tax=Dictyostelium purpureum TaxID=5786 RepID=F0ZYQ5_DICPU|nr:uncharacterized protein DICPUDRAFT_157280 [Dictyostelium purpureum]EGC30928.1 hypothetical protein DICPUDRAFT_157280 [Dictyostelium purpureum]|eukprot:XP_003292557.1 hypothetical protein DICPUDRAFT_157280 [Dictyostelium purpureum]